MTETKYELDPGKSPDENWDCVKSPSNMTVAQENSLCMLQKRHYIENVIQITH